MKRLHRWVALTVGAVTVAAGFMTAPAAFAAPADAAIMVACTAPAWAEGVSYAAGAQVTYGGRLYRARVAHTPPVGAGWEPGRGRLAVGGPRRLRYEHAHYSAYYSAY